MKTEVNYRLYLVTMNEEITTQLAKIELALKAGVTIVQIRNKYLPSKEFLKEVQKLKNLTDQFNVPLIVNDRLEVALESDADGLHVGQSDLSVEEARIRLGTDKIIGASVHNLQEALAAEKAGADYLGVGAMFPTITKPDAKIVSTKELQRICQKVTIPIVLIGGINAATISRFNRFPIQGFAVVSAILKAKEVKASTKKLCACIHYVQKEKS